MTTQFTTKVLFIVLAAVCCGAVLAPALAQRPVAGKGENAISGVRPPRAWRNE